MASLQFPDLRSSPTPQPRRSAPGGPAAHRQPQQAQPLAQMQLSLLDDCRHCPPRGRQERVRQQEVERNRGGGGPQVQSQRRPREGLHAGGQLCRRWRRAAGRRGSSRRVVQHCAFDQGLRTDRVGRDKEQLAPQTGCSGPTPLLHCACASAAAACYRRLPLRRTCRLANHQYRLYWLPGARSNRFSISRVAGTSLWFMRSV